MTDFYADLGVPANATQEEIETAGKRRSKETHPDRVGDPATFDRVRRALVVLRDPAKRAKYDADGDTGDQPEGYDGAFAMQFITSKVLAILASGADLRRTDVMRAVRSQIMSEIQSAKNNIADTERAIARLRDGLGRFKHKGEGQDWLTAAIDHQIRQMRVGIASAESDITKRELALELLDEYDYQVDPPPSAETLQAQYEQFVLAAQARPMGFFRS